MAIIRCRNGHNYDSNKYNGCPICANVGGIQEAAPTYAPDDAKKTLSLGGMPGDPTRVLGGVEEDNTIRAFAEELENAPVVGWLVCVEGPGNGRDYRLRAGRNFIGRSFKMNVHMVEDQQIAQENHASIIYEPIASRFILLSGNGICTELNGEPVSGAVDIKEGDSIKLGGSVLDFVAYCKGEKRWK